MRMCEEGRLLKLSRAVTKVLRHDALKLGLTVRCDGYISLEAVLDALSESGGGKRARVKARPSVASVRAMVAQCPKQRTSLSSSAAGMGGVLHIRANQGHSFPPGTLDDAQLLVRITRCADIPLVVHGTTFKAWISIQASGGLSRMKRNHVHFACGLPGASGVISGMRRASEVLVYVDADAAMRGGLVFYRSANGVILTAGDSRGCVPLAFVSRAVRASDGSTLRRCRGGATLVADEFASRVVGARRGMTMAPALSRSGQCSRYDVSGRSTVLVHEAR